MRLDYEYEKKKLAAYIDDRLIATSDGITMSGPLGFDLCVMADNLGMGVNVFFDNFSVVSPPPAAPKSSAKNTAPSSLSMNAPGVRNAVTEPEAAVLKLMLAIAMRDGNAIFQRIIPHPRWGLLCFGEKAPASVALDLETRILNGPSKLRELVAGDRIYLGERIQVLKDSDFMAGQILLQQVDVPHETFVVKRMHGEWKVGIAFLIESVEFDLRRKSEEIQLEEPEEAIVKFMLAVMKGDKVALEKSIAPNPEWKILAESRHASEEDLPLLEAQLRLTSYKRLRAGDSFSLGTGKTHVIQAAEITEDRLLIDQKGSPFPFVLVRSNGVWKVDVGPILASRKAAAAARKQ